MAFKYNTYTLKKLETLFQELDYAILYEKGTFRSGYCIVQQRRVAVVNKYFETEARINTLLEILGLIEVDEGRLSESSLKLLKKVNQTFSEMEEEQEEEAREDQE